MARLWNHSLKGSYPRQELDKITGTSLYAARALALSQPGDIVQITDELSEQYPLISEHYQRVGLRHAKTIIWNDALEVAADYPGHEWRPFLFSEYHHRISPNEAWFNAVQRLNDKSRFIEFCIEAGEPVPLTYRFENAAEFKRSGMEGPFPAFVKKAVSASGAGVFRVESLKELFIVLEEFGENAPFQIQEDLGKIPFLCVQYFGSNGAVSRVGATQQILKGYEHAGNKYPIDYNVFDFCDPLAKKVAELGVQGIFAFDVAVSAQGRFFFIECNPRVNGSTYPWFIAEKLDAKCWIASNVATDKMSLEQYEFAGTEYSLERGEGVVLVNWGPVLHGKLGILTIASSHDRCTEIATRFALQNDAH